MLTILPRERAIMRRATACVTKNYRVEIGRHDLAPVQLRKVDGSARAWSCGLFQDIDRTDVFLELRDGASTVPFGVTSEGSPRRRWHPSPSRQTRGRGIPPIDDDARARRDITFRDRAADAAARGPSVTSAGGGEIEHVVMWIPSPA
jgi:hypothetical protein